MEYTKKVVYLEDGDVAVVNPKKALVIRNINDEEHLRKRPYFQKLEMSLDQLERAASTPTC